jgi:2-hydroxy-3-oxopropionate reductase
VKDLDTVLDAAHQAKLELPLAARVTELFRQLAGDGGGGYDHSGLLLELEKRNAPARLGSIPDTLPA